MKLCLAKVTSHRGWRFPDLSQISPYTCREKSGINMDIFKPCSQWSSFMYFSRNQTQLNPVHSCKQKIPSHPPATTRAAHMKYTHSHPLPVLTHLDQSTYTSNFSLFVCVCVSVCVCVCVCVSPIN